MPIQSDAARLKECLTYLDKNPSAKGTQWGREVIDEARELGLVAQPIRRLGRYCRPGIDRGIVYGGDMADAF